MSSFILKILAVVTMTIDHIGYALLPNIIILRIIGRLAMPLFAFQIALGFRHTSDRKKYIFRLLLFAIISQIPYMLLASTHLSKFKLNILFTFLFSALIIYSVEEIKPLWGKILCLLPICTLALTLNYEYGIYGIILVLIFYYTHNNRKLIFPLQYCALLAFCIYIKNFIHIYSIFSVIPILLYNGKKGPGFKYFFYLFYPLHMLVIYIIFKLCL